MYTRLRDLILLLSDSIVLRVLFGSTEADGRGTDHVPQDVAGVGGPVLDDVVWRVHCPRSGPGQVRPHFADHGPEPQGLVH